MGVDVSKFAEPLTKCSHDCAFYVLNGCDSECQCGCVRCHCSNPREEEEEETEVL